MNIIQPFRREKSQIVPLDKVFEALKEFEITDEEQAELEKEKAKQDSPFLIASSDKFLTLENIVCTDADGNVFEKYPALQIRKDVFRMADQKGHQNFTPYQAIAYCEQQGLFLPSFALSCNILATLYQGKSDPAIAKVLVHYKDYGSGYGWHAQNTVVHWGAQEIVHYPQDSDFPVCGGQNKINSTKPRKSLRFKTAGFQSVYLEEALWQQEYFRYLKNLTGLRDPSILVKIGEYYGKEARVWISSSDETRAAWLGCRGDSFSLDGDSNLDSDDAARGVREEQPSASAP